MDDDVNISHPVRQNVTEVGHSLSDLCDALFREWCAPDAVHTASVTRGAGVGAGVGAG